MGQNFGRYIEIQLYDENHEGIILSELTIEFKISKQPGSRFDAGTADITFYNLSSQTEKSIMDKKFKRLQVIAGYLGFADDDGSYPDKNCGVIFDGDIRTAGLKVDKGDNKISRTDRVLEISCVASWEAHLFAAVRKTLPAGWCYRDMFDACIEAYKEHGVTSGNAPELPETVFPRAKVIHSPASEVVYQIAEKSDCHWWYDNGQLYMVPDEGYLNKTVILNANTGLLGNPLPAKEGITLRCLINPEICLRGHIRLDQKLQYVRSGRFSYTELKQIPSDGDYVVNTIQYEGKTRGNEWYMTLECQPLNQAKPVQAAAKSH